MSEREKVIAKRRIVFSAGALIGATTSVLLYKHSSKSIKHDKHLPTYLAIGAGTTLMAVCTSILYRSLLPDPPLSINELS